MSISNNNIKTKIISLLDSNQLDLSRLAQTENMFSIHSRKYKVSLETTIRYFFEKRKHATTQLLELLNISLLELFSDEIFKVTVFNVFGCPLSTDIDLAILVPRIIDEQFLILDSVYSKLAELGYDTTLDIDLVQVVIDASGNISESSKGSKETQNMIYYTYRSHVQCYPPIFSNPSKFELFDKIKSVGKYVLDHLDDIIGIENYHLERDNKRKHYLNVIDRTAYTNEILQKYVITEFNSVLKGLCVKMFQCLITHSHPEYIREIYQKESLGRIFAKLYLHDPNIILPMLTRGRLGTPDLEQANISYQQVVNLFVSISTLYIENILDLSQSIEFNVKPDDLENVLYSEFLKSPLGPTDLFVSEMERVSPNRKLNQVFIIHSNYEQVRDYLDPTFIDKHVELVDQRTPEWLDMLKYYQCGKSTGIVPYNGTTYRGWIETYYNLVRGSIGELLITTHCDFNSALQLVVVKFHCGLLIEEKRPNAPGIAPDLLLVDTLSRKIIPVEIKCMVGSPEYSSDLVREIKLARNQLSTCRQILAEHYYGYSLIVIMFIQFINDKYEYTVRYNKVI